MSREAWPKRLWGWLQRNKWMVSFGASYAILIAMVGLVVEDATLLFGPQEGQSAALVFAARLMLLGIAGCLTAWLYAKVSDDAKRRGTAYYVRLLDASMSDWNASAVRKLTKRDFRSASQTVDVAAPWRIEGDPSSVNGYVSIVNDIETVASEFECAMNSDSDDRGSQVIPNLVAPAALALGYGWTVGDGATELVEVNPDGPLVTHSFRFTEASLHEFALQQNPEWHQAGRPMFPTSDVGAIQLWDIPRKEGIRPENVERVWLTIKLSKNGPFGQVGVVDSDAADRFKADLVRVVGGFGAWHPEVKSEQMPFLSLLPVEVPDDNWSKFMTPEERDGKVLASPQALSWATAAAIHRTLEDFPKATVMVSLQTPKTVNVAAGLLLQGSNPWDRLVPVFYLNGKNYLMKTRRDQRRPVVVSPTSAGVPVRGAPVRLVNLTPHRLCVLDGEVTIIDLPGTSSPARVAEHVEVVPALRTGTPEVYVPAVLISQNPRIINLPDPEPGVEFVVSRITAAACSRTDVLFPYDEVRDRDGRIVGCRALARFDRHTGEPRA